MSGWTVVDALDLLAKFAPAATIIAAVIAAQTQWRNQQRLNAITIAKNHYREMLELLLKNADLVAMGATPEAFERLKADSVNYRRYVMLFAVVSFAMQEIYFATNPRKEKHWGEVIGLFMGAFHEFTASSDHFRPDMQRSVHPDFDAFVGEVMQKRSFGPLIC